MLLQGTLVGLLAAFSYELSILHTASRLTSADAFRTLHALYRERTHPVVASYASAAPGSRGGGECARSEGALGPVAKRVQALAGKPLHGTKPNNSFIDPWSKLLCTLPVVQPRCHAPVI